jgi:hypothetical protein
MMGQKEQSKLDEILEKSRRKKEERERKKFERALKKAKKNSRRNRGQGG